jgi:hypothetical protein
MLLNIDKEAFRQKNKIKWPMFFDKHCFCNWRKKQDGHVFLFWDRKGSAVWIKYWAFE